MRLASLRTLAFVASALLGCGPLETGGIGDGSSSSSTSTTDPGTASLTTTTTTTATTTSATSTTTTTTDASTTDASTTTDANSGSFIVSADEANDSGSGGPQPNGSDCEAASDCESGFCFDGPGPNPGRCSECLMDADCDMGTCSFEFEMGFAVCTDGALGDGCDSDEGCMGALVCAPQLGDFAEHCSECGETAPCDAGVCSPFYDGSPFQGYLHCVDPGTVENGDGCPIIADDMGDGSVCMSGICGIASVMMGNVQIGVCSECDSDDDCPDGTTCDTAHFMMMMGLVPGTCV